MVIKSGNRRPAGGLVLSNGNAGCWGARHARQLQQGARQREARGLLEQTLVTKAHARGHQEGSGAVQQYRVSSCQAPCQGGPSCDTHPPLGCQSCAVHMAMQHGESEPKTLDATTRSFDAAQLKG